MTDPAYLVVLSNGDTADADTFEDARYAATTIQREADEARRSQGPAPTVTIIERSQS